MTPEQLKRIDKIRTDASSALYARCAELSQRDAHDYLVMTAVAVAEALVAGVGKDHALEVLNRLIRDLEKSV